MLRKEEKSWKRSVFVWVLVKPLETYSGGSNALLETVEQDVDANLGEISIWLVLIYGAAYV